MSIQSDYLLELSKTAHSQMQDQINKRQSIIGVWLTIFSIATGAVFMLAPPIPIRIKVILLVALLVEGIFINAALIGLVAWQHVYKQTYIIIGKIIMNRIDTSNLSQIKELIAFSIAPLDFKYKFLYNIRSTTNLIMLLCFIGACFPLFFLLEITCTLNVLSSLIALLVSLVYIFTLTYRLQRAIHRKCHDPHQLVWLLNFSFSDPQ